MRTYHFEQIQLIPRPLEEVFLFFADANNLEVITSGWMRFEVLTAVPIVMETGAHIQ